MNTKYPREWALFFLTFPIKSYGKIFLRRRVVKDSVAVPQLYPFSNYVHPSKSHTQIKSSTCHGKMINYSKKILSNIWQSTLTKKRNKKGKYEQARFYRSSFTRIQYRMPKESNEEKLIVLLKQSWLFFFFFFF